MDARVGLLVLFLLGASSCCDARQLEKPLFSEIQTSEDVAKNDNICTLCEEYTALAIEYLNRNETQTEILEHLHQSCSQLHSFKQQALNLSTSIDAFSETM